MHSVPRAARSDPNPIPIQLSDAACTLQDGVREELQVRLRRMLAEQGRRIVEDGRTGSEVPRVIRNYLESSDDSFVETSRRLATILREVQSGANSGGLLLVAEGRFNITPVGLANPTRDKSLIIVKFQQERGIRAERTANGMLQTFDMQFLRDLFLTDRSKVYKVGLFPASGIRDGLLHGWAADYQMTGGKVAVFFLRRYLGCDHLEEPEELTRRYFERSQEWVNKTVKDPLKKARYAIAIFAELQSERRTISIEKFASEHLSTFDQDSYVSYLVEGGVPRATFDKDISLVRPHLEKLQFAFANGAVVAFPVSALDDESVKIEPAEGNKTTLTITGEMREVKGKGAPGRKPGDGSPNQK